MHHYTDTKIYNQSALIVEGWYWALPAHRVKKGQIVACHLMGRELAIYRGMDGEVRVLDAYCPHMGAHLAEGKVEGNCVRCFFHNWRFNPDGKCSDIPCMPQKSTEHIRAKTWRCREKYGLIWVWVGDHEPPHDVPEPAELKGSTFDWSLGNKFFKACHPHVVMVNAIDEQHFRTVHHLPGSILKLETRVIDRWCLEVSNTGKVPQTSWLGKFFSKFYKGPLFYTLNYWYGTIGFTSFGPDFLHLHLMFALRQTAEGKTEGQTIAFTKPRNGILGWLFNRCILFATKIGGLYFAYGDTRVFQTIRFKLKTPIAADKTVMAFIQHVEQQQTKEWKNA